MYTVNLAQKVTISCRKADLTFRTCDLKIDYLNLTFKNLNYQRMQTGTSTGTLNTQAGFWVVHRTVRLANKETAIAIEELAITVVE